MKFFDWQTLLFAALSLGAKHPLWAQAKIMNPGEAIGQMVILSAQDVTKESAKYKSLNPLSIPVFAELPLDLSVTAGAITLKQQNLLSHVQLKSRARRTPNLDISQLEGGLQNALLSAFRDGDWIRMKLDLRSGILIERSNKQAAEKFYADKKTVVVKLISDLSIKKIYKTSELSSSDFVRVGSKAANYGELAKALNTPERTVVRPGFAVPMAYYQEFLDSNPKVQTLIRDILDDPIMEDLTDVNYRSQRLQELRDLMMSSSSVVNPQLVADLLAIYDQQKNPKGLLRKMKMRSSTNSEDLPNFNGAGLYDSAAYKPYKGEKEKTRAAKEAALREVLQTVWASVWQLRAFDERNFYGIPHADVKMGMQVNPSFGFEDADGVVVTKNVSGDSRFPESGVYIETQRGDTHSVANPQPGAKPQKILVVYNPTSPLDTSAYQVNVLQNSNIADDNILILGRDNPVPVMTDAEAKDLSYLVLKAREHFKPILGKNNPHFELDLEFKVDSEDAGARRIYLKQARPYIQ